MFDPPSSEALLRAARDFIKEKLIPDLKDQSRFHALVAVNVLEIVMREIVSGEAAREREKARLQRLLGLEDGLSLEEANRRLCKKIEAGEISLETLKDHLWETVLDKVAVDQPRYGKHQK